MESSQTPAGINREIEIREFSALFRSAREAKSCSVKSLAQLTRISAGFIDALENGEFSKLPGEVFGRGFVRSICKALHLDSETLIAAYDRCWDSDSAAAPVLEIKIKEKPYHSGTIFKIADFIKLGVFQIRGRPRLLIAAICVAGLGSALLWQIKRLPITAWKNRIGQEFFLSKQLAPSQSDVASAKAPLPVNATTNHQAGPPTVEPNSSGSVPQVLQPQPAAQVPPEAEKIEISREGTGQQLLEIIVSEKVRLRTDIDAGGGQTKEYLPGIYQIKFVNKIDMMVFDAAAVKLTFNGRNIGSLGNKGRVRRISFQSNSSTARKM